MAFIQDVLKPVDIETSSDFLASQTQQEGEEVNQVLRRAASQSEEFAHITSRNIANSLAQQKMASLEQARQSIISNPSPVNIKQQETAADLIKLQANSYQSTELLPSDKERLNNLINGTYVQFKTHAAYLQGQNIKKAGEQNEMSQLSTISQAIQDSYSSGNDKEVEKTLLNGIKTVNGFQYMSEPQKSATVLNYRESLRILRNNEASPQVKNFPGGLSVLHDNQNSRFNLLTSEATLKTKYNFSNMLSLKNPFSDSVTHLFDKNALEYNMGAKLAVNELKQGATYPRLVNELNTIKSTPRSALPEAERGKLDALTQLTNQLKKYPYEVFTANNSQAFKLQQSSLQKQIAIKNDRTISPEVKQREIDSISDQTHLSIIQLLKDSKYPIGNITLPISERHVSALARSFSDPNISASQAIVQTQNSPLRGYIVNSFSKNQEGAVFMATHMLNEKNGSPTQLQLDMISANGSASTAVKKVPVSSDDRDLIYSHLESYLNYVVNAEGVHSYQNIKDAVLKTYQYQHVIDNISASSFASSLDSSLPKIESLNLFTGSASAGNRTVMYPENLIPDKWRGHERDIFQEFSNKADDDIRKTVELHYPNLSEFQKQTLISTKLNSANQTIRLGTNNMIYLYNSGGKVIYQAEMTPQLVKDAILSHKKTVEKASSKLTSLSYWYPNA